MKKNKEQKKEEHPAFIIYVQGLLDIVNKLQTSCDLFTLSEKEFEKRKEDQFDKTFTLKQDFIMSIINDIYMLDMVDCLDNDILAEANSDNILNVLKAFIDYGEYTREEVYDDLEKTKLTSLDKFRGGETLQILEFIYIRLEKILNAKEYKPSKDKDFFLDLIALHYYYGIPIGPNTRPIMLDLKFEEALFKLIMMWKNKKDEINKSISEKFRKQKSASTKIKNKEELKQKILNIHNDKLKKDPDWTKYTSRNKRTLYIYEKLGRKVSEKTITRRLKEIEEKN